MKTVIYSPFKDKLDRALNWVLSPNGWGRIPLENSDRQLLLIEGNDTKYFVERKPSGKLLIKWTNASGTSKEKTLSKPNVIRWLKKTQGNSPPPEDNNEGFLTIPEVAEKYNVSVSKARADVARLTAEEQQLFTKRHQGDNWLVSEVILDRMYKDSPKRQAVDLDAFQPSSEYYLPLKNIASNLDIPFETVRTFVRRKRDKLVQRRFIRRHKGKLELHTELAEAVWGEK